MPSPSRRYAQRSSPRKKGAAAAAANEQWRRTNSTTKATRTSSSSNRKAKANAKDNAKSKDSAVVGKRTGVTLPPRGEIPVDDEGIEDPDAFFAAAESPAFSNSQSNSRSPGSHGSGNTGSPSSPSKAYGKRAEKARERERKEDEKRRRRSELEAEGGRNAKLRPDILNANDYDDDDDDFRVENEGEGDENGGRKGKPRASSSFLPTPKQPGWSNRLMHQAMGVPTEDSPQFTVLSKVSTAPPSTSHRSVDTIATEAMHALRGEQEGAQLDSLLAMNNNGEEEEEGSPSVNKVAAEGRGRDAEASPSAPVAEARGRDADERDNSYDKEEEEEEKELEFAGPMDPPEEMSQNSSLNEEKRGVDPEERDVYLEPEEKGDGDDISAKPSAKSAKSAAASAKSAELEEDDVSSSNLSAKPSAKSAASAKSGASSKTDALENSLEEVVASNYNADYDDADDDIGGGGMQLSTQPDDDDNRFETEEADFGGGNDGDFGDDMDMGDNEDDDMGDNDAMSNAASQHSRKSSMSDNSDMAASQKSRGSLKSNKSQKSQESFKSNNSYKSDKSDMMASQKSRASFKTNNSYKSDRSQLSEQPSLSDEEEEEEEPPRKKKAKKDKYANNQSPATPTSVLRTKKSKKKKHPNNRVNWSTPNGNARGMPAGNRGYEAVPVSDYKDQYPPGEEPRTPGGSALRRSKRAKFKPLAFWKNEKLLYEAQNEKGLLGEAMGDMPVVAGVLHALPTPYKEKKRKDPPIKKKAAKKRSRDSDDEGSDDESRRTKTPFDDTALRKKHRIKNGESCEVWSETLESAADVKIVSRLDNRTFSKLPLSSGRKTRESKVVGFASQAFHVPTDDDDLFPGYIAGNVVLPPRGIKDAEGVGLCSQVFNISDCQPGSVEFAIADPSGQDGEFDPKTAQRYLLSKGDMFQIPPGNVYRIENHSKTEKCNLFWTIIKCTSRAEQEDSEEEEEEEED